MQILALFMLFWIVNGLLFHHKAIRFSASVFFSLCICLQLLSYYTTLKPFNMQVMNHLSWSTFRISLLPFKWHWTLFLILMCCFICIFASKRLNAFYKSLRTRRVAMGAVLMAALAILFSPGGIITELYWCGYGIMASRSDHDLESSLRALKINPIDYTYPEMIKTEGASRKNIVVISLESFEESYLLRKDLTENLNRFAENGYLNMNFLGMQGSKDTISALYSWHTGIPLFFNIFHNGVFQHYEMQNNQSSLITVLGKSGFETSYVGSAPDFIAQDKLLKGLGYDNIKGYKKEINEVSEMQRDSGFGDYDYDVFILAKQELNRLASQRKPFMLTISTLDTHYPGENNDPRAISRFPDENISIYERNIKWVDYLCGEFLQYLEETIGLENTLVVIMPDHAYPGKSKINNEDKRNLFLISNSMDIENDYPIDTQINHFDIPEIILDAAGVKSNAVFLSDFAKRSGDRIDEKWIAENKANIINLNMAFWKRIHESFTISKEKDAFVFASGNFRREFSVGTNECLYGSLDEFRNTNVITMRSIPFYLIKSSNSFIPTQSIVITQRGDSFSVIVNPYGFGGKVYHSESGKPLTIDWKDCDEIDANNRILPAYYGGTYHYPGSENVLFVRSVGKNAENKLGYSHLSYNDRIIRVTDGITAIYREDDYLVYSLYDVQHERIARRFILDLESKIRGRKFLALIVGDNVGEIHPSIYPKLHELGFLKITQIGEFEPYIAVTTYPGAGGGAISELTLDANPLLHPQNNMIEAVVNFSGELNAAAPLIPVYSDCIDEVAEFHAKSSGRYYANDTVSDDMLENIYISHAGGIIDGHTYTNSKESVESSIGNGAKFIELDLLLSTDGQIVAAHDWNMFNRITGFSHLGDKALSLSEFNSRLIHGKYTPLSGDTIREIFDKYQNIILVTDKISDPGKLKSFPFKDRLIIETYSIYSYMNMLRNGYENLFFNVEDERRLREAKYYGMTHVTASLTFIMEHLSEIKQLHDYGCTVIGYGLFPKEMGVEKPDQEFFDKYIGNYMSMYYADY